MPIDDYILERQIGKGATGDVYLATKKKTGLKFVIKKVDVKGNENKKRKIANEIQIMKKLPYSINFANYMASFTSKDEGGNIENIYIVMDYIENSKDFINFIKSGYLAELVEKGDYGFIFSIMYQIANAINIIHKAGIIHGDIKPHNMLYSESSKTITIIDFDLACFINVNRSCNKTVGTPNYIAPEVLYGAGLSEKSDVWSIGVTFYYMMFGFPPFETKTIEDTFEMIKNTDPEINSGIKNFDSLLKKMLEKDKYGRASMDDVVMSLGILSKQEYEYDERMKELEQSETS